MTYSQKLPIVPRIDSYDGSLLLCYYNGPSDRPPRQNVVEGYNTRQRLHEELAPSYYYNKTKPVDLNDPHVIEVFEAYIEDWEIPVKPVLRKRLS